MKDGREPFPGGQGPRTSVAGLAILLLCLSRVAWGEPVAVIRDNGDPANRVDIVVLGDGYTADELGKYATDVETFVQGTFAQEPFQEYARYFNVHRVDVVSNESGADHPEREPPVFKDTALDATYNCAGIQRLICVDVSKVNTVVSQSLSAAAREVIVVLVNDVEYGGSGGAVAVASVHPAVVELVLHELGHSFGLLADEYGGPPPPACNASIEPSEANATKETQRELIKWTSWIDLSTPIPTPGPDPGLPGLYEGARYCDTGLYRPTYNSKMRSLGPPYEQINTEQLVKRVYNWASPIDAVEPSASAVVLSPGQSQTFDAHVLQPATHSLTVVWRLDGQLAGTGSQYVLDASSLTAGTHVLKVKVKDHTTFVRSDPASVLREVWTWDVTVVVGMPDLVETAVSDPPPSVGLGGTFSVMDTVENQGTAAAGPSRTRYYLSLDTVRDSGDTRLIGARLVSGLDPGATSSGSTTVAVNTATLPGTYFLLACADDKNGVAEGSETNNCVASGTTVVVTPVTRSSSRH